PPGETSAKGRISSERGASLCAKRVYKRGAMLRAPHARRLLQRSPEKLQFPNSKARRHRLELLWSLLFGSWTLRIRRYFLQKDRLLVGWLSCKKAPNPAAFLSGPRLPARRTPCTTSRTSATRANCASTRSASGACVSPSKSATKRKARRTPSPPS